MNKIKYSIKLIISYFLYFFGLLNLYKYLFFRNKSIVLMYHRILSEKEHLKSHSHDGIIVHVDSFKRQIKFLSSQFNILTINEFSEHINEHKSFNTNTCLITFDDGWYDNYTNAWPVLKTYQAPAHIFLPINYISNSDLFWQEKLSHYIYHMSNFSELFTQFLKKHAFITCLQIDIEKRKLFIRELVSKLKILSPDKIKLLLDECECEMRTNGCIAPQNVTDSYLSWDNVTDMQNSLISFGSHAMSHHILTKLTPQQLENELSRSKKIIQSKTGKTVNSIAYPNGNHDKMVCEMSKLSGYKLGFTTKHGYAAPTSAALSIPRINIHDDMTKSIPLFYCRILGIF